MPKKPTEQVMLPSPMSFGVEEGTEVTVDGPIWKQMVIPHGDILEVCYAGASLGLGTEEWFAVLVEKVEGSVEDGWQVTGRFLGTENPTLSVETVAVLEEGFVHLCPGDPCPRTADEDPSDSRYKGKIVETYELQLHISLWRGRQHLQSSGCQGEEVAYPPGSWGSSWEKACSQTRSGKSGARTRHYSRARPPQDRSSGRHDQPGVRRGGGPCRRRGACLTYYRRSAWSFARYAAANQREDSRWSRSWSACDGRRGFDWWRRSCWLKPCSGRVQTGSWDCLQPCETDPPAIGRIGGYKRRRYEALDEETFWGEQGIFRVAGASRAAVGPGCQSPEAEEAREVQEGQCPAVAELVEGQGEEGQEEPKGKTPKGTAGPRCGSEARSRGSRRIQFKRLRQRLFKGRHRQGPGGLRGGHRSGVRGPTPQTSGKAAWQCHGDVDQARTGTDGPRVAVRKRRFKSRPDKWNKGVHLLCPPNSSLSCDQLAAGQGALCFSSEHRSSPDGTITGDSGCSSIPLHSSSHCSERGQLADGEPIRALPARTSGQRLHSDYAGSPETPSPGLKEPRLGAEHSLVGGRWQGEELRQWQREGSQGRSEGQGQRKMERSQPRPGLGQQGRDESLARQQGGRTEEAHHVRAHVVSQNSVSSDGLEVRLAPAAPSLPGWLGDHGVFNVLAERCSCFDSLGRAMAWVLFRFPQFDLDVGASVGARLAIMGRTAMNYAMHRGPVKRHRPLFPLPLGDLVRVREAAWTSDFAAFCAPHFADLSMEEVWTAVTVLGLNGTAGYGRADLRRRATAMQADALKNIKQTVSRVLSADCALERPPAQAEKELAMRFVSYTGEEVPKMQVLSIKAAKGALPPSSHGGSIDASGLVSEGTKWFLERPEESLVEAPPKDVKLQARVHIKAGEALDFFKLLVERNICTWVADDDVLVVRGEKVLNGMFAVGKGTCVEPGLELQRTIMNLIPSNAVLAQAQGGTQDLPAITQYLSLVVGNDHDVVFFQSDMSSAFYLFRIPAGWSRMMCFNAVYPGHLLGLGAETYFRPACAVIPMGWNSAVSVMQEIAEKLTVLARLPPENRVRRLAPLPVWLTNTMQEAEKQNRPWYHVYLDNFCAMQLTTAGKSADAGHSLHDALEEAWSNQGVLSSAKKRIAGAATVQELGAYFQGRSGTIGPSAERLLRLVQTTLVCLGKKRLKHKWIQVIAGRWVHCMSFRRAAMVVLDQTWAYLAGKTDRPVSEDRVRQELFACCCIGLMIHSNLRARISSVTTASDASMTGGAVGQSRELTVSGQEFAFADHSEQSGGRILPILVLSLFNGIGGCFRCYDLVGVTPMVAISYELSKEGNRITSRRWPHVRIEKDVRSILAATVREWRLAYPAVEEIHVWGGFPCVGLSSVRAGRLNLDDPESGLFWELVRVIKLIRQVFGYGFKVKYAAENVASMDASAEAEISQALGVKPLRMDPAGVVPIHRPRYCWSNTELAAMDGVWVEEKERWFEVHMEQPYPDPKQWMEPDAEWPGYSAGAILPTCMKCIKRVRPPPKPAGLDWISNDGRLRWIADDFRFPPINMTIGLSFG